MSFRLNSLFLIGLIVLCYGFFAGNPAQAQSNNPKNPSSSRGNLSVDYLQSVEVASAALPAKMSLSLQAPGHKAFLQMHWKIPAVEAVSLPPIKIPADYRKLKLGF
jgi:hypothetical protein